MKINLSLYLVFVCSFMVFSISCSKGDDSPDSDKQSLEAGIIDPVLVGTWVGTVDGSFGSADMTMILDNDGTVSAEGTIALNCSINGKWEVLGNEFKINGNDDCDGTAITLNAPYSKLRLAGNWNASNGNNGTFSVVKQ